MKMEKKSTFAGEDITIRELTVEEVSNIVDGMSEGDPDPIQLLFPDRIPSGGICRSTGLKKEALEKVTPSELDALIKEVEEVNPFFDQMLKRFVKIGEAVSDAEMLKKAAST